MTHGHRYEGYPDYVVPGNGEFLGNQITHFCVVSKNHIIPELPHDESPCR